MQRAKRKSAERDARLPAPHGKPEDNAAGSAGKVAEVTSLRKQLLEMIVRHETERKAKPK